MHRIVFKAPGLKTTGIFRAGKMDFKVEGLWNNETYFRPPWLTDKKNFCILVALEWLGDSLVIASVVKICALKNFAILTGKH